MGPLEHLNSPLPWLTPWRKQASVLLPPSRSPLSAVSAPMRSLPVLGVRASVPKPFSCTLCVPDTWCEG